MTNFAELGLAAPILEMLAAEQYVTPTPIQAGAIPHILAGRDLLGIAQTGTGKTAAFALPILHRLAAKPVRAPRRGCRVLVLAPTRELASQINESFRVYGRRLHISSTVIFGGVGAGPQIRALNAGVDVVVATPGRLLDHLDQGNIRLESLEVLVLDEVDRMLDMGFIQPVRRIVRATTKQRQTLVFSATMPPDIRKLAADLLDDPVEVAVTPVASTVERIEQRVIHVDARDKPALLSSILNDTAVSRALVFTRTKRGADKVSRHLEASGVGAAAIHGNKSQGQREQALASFRSGGARVLVATDIAARGIDVDGITHVINFELPNIPESYVHRIGRTARAGAAGTAISFCDAEERAHLRGIEALIRQRLPAEDHRGGGPRTPRPVTRADGTVAPLDAATPAVAAVRPAHAQPSGQPAKKRRPLRSGAKPAPHGAGKPASPQGSGKPAPQAAAGAAQGRHDLSNVRFLSQPSQRPRSGHDTAGAGSTPRRPRRASAR